MNWLDWLILVLLAYSTYRGLALGFLASAARLAGIVLGVAAAFSYYQQLAFWLFASFRLDEVITPLVNSIFARFLPVQTVGGNEAAPVFSSWPKANTAFSTGPLVSADLWARSVSLCVLEAVSFLLIVFAVSWAAAIAGSLLTRLAGFALLGPFNRLGGLLLGLVRGLVFVTAVVYLLCQFASWPAITGGGFPVISGAIAGSRLLPLFVPLFNALGHPIP